MEQNFEYFAFISYKREDEKWAKWLQRKLEHYKLPTVIAKEKPELPKKIWPVFKDTTDIKPGILADVLTQNLNTSKYLIVICSPRAAKSQWVGKEISEFVALGKQNNIILLIIEGLPYSKNLDTECYHPVIKEKLPEMLGVNINEEGVESRYIKKQKAFIRVVSTLLDVSFDSLWQRQKRRIIRNWIFSTLGALFFVLSLVVVSIYQKKIHQKFDVQITLKEKTFHNPNLPFENGYIKLCYDKDTLVSKPINSYNQIIEFDKIPGEYRGVKAKVWFEMFGFESRDTIVQLNTPILIMIARDNAYCKVQGYVRDKKSDSFLSGVTVEIGNEKVITNDSGYFMIEIPIKKQKENYKVILRKGGRITKDQIVYPTKNEPTISNTSYFK